MRLSLVLIACVKAAGVALAVAGGSPACSAALFFVPDLWVLYHLFIPGTSGLVRVFTHFETPRPEVWLTIDDGPDPADTPRILDLLDRHGARATFFLIGERAARHPSLVAEIARRGHEIAHHTQTHPARSFWCASPGRTRRELDNAMLPLTPPGGSAPRRFRPPVGFKNLFLKRALTERGLACVAWNARSFDTLARDPEKVARRVLRQSHPGAILLLHEGPSLHPRVRIHALDRILTQLSARDLRCVIPDDAQLR